MLSFYDRACRYLVAMDPHAVFAWLLRPHRRDAVVSLEFLGLAPERTRPAPGGGAEGVNDLVGLFADKLTLGTPWAVVLEFQARLEPDMFDRLIEYMVARRRMERVEQSLPDRYEVMGIVVNLRGTATCARKMAMPETGGVLDFAPVERNLEALDADMMIKPVATGGAPDPVLGWVPLMGGGNTQAVVAAWRARVAGIQNPRTRTDIVRLAEVFANIPRTRPVWREMRDMITERCEVVDEWIAEHITELLLRVLRKRFQSVPEDIESAIRRETSPARIDLLVETAASAADLAEFERALAAG